MGGEREATTVSELVTRGILERPLDGNHGSKHPRAQDFVASGVPFIMASDLAHGGIDTANCSFITMEQAKSLGKGFAKRGDVLLSHKATLGRTAIVSELPGDFVVLTPQVTYYRVKDPTRLNNRYLKYYFDSESFQQVLRSWAGAGSTRAYIGITDQLRLPVVLPPLPEQRAIAHILGTLDDKIELNRRMNATLEAMARALFKSWFVDFDPVRAKAEGRDPGLPKHLADLFPDCLVDSELGEIPLGWEVKGVYWNSEVFYGAPFKSALFNEIRVGRPLIRIRDLATHDPGIWTPEEPPRGYLVQPGDLIVGMDGEFRAHLWRGPEGWLNQRVCCFKPKPKVPRAFVHYSIESLLDFFERSKTGTTVIHLGKGDIDTFRVLRPRLSVLEAFGALLDPVDSRIVVTARQSRTLIELRDTLLPKLISGELKVRDAERVVETIGA